MTASKDAPHGGTHKVGDKWTNGKGHGKFKSKKKADDQRKAMFANGYVVSDEDEKVINYTLSNKRGWAH